MHAQSHNIHIEPRNYAIEILIVVRTLQTYASALVFPTWGRAGSRRLSGGSRLPRTLCGALLPFGL